MNARWARWVGLWTRREQGESIALFRIASGLCLLYGVGSVLVQGLAPVLWLDQADGGCKPLPSPPWLFGVLGGLTPTSLGAVVAVALGAGLLLVVGLAGRLAAFLAVQSFTALSDLNSASSASDDLLLANALWLLVLARSTASLSLACRLRTGQWVSTERIPCFPRYLAIYQLVLMYCSSGLHKVSAYWLPGGDFSALYYILQQPSWQRCDLTWLAWVYPLTQIGTALTWFWEVSAPLLLLALWYQATPERTGWVRAAFNGLNFRRLFVLIGVTMHLLIFLLMDVGAFSWVALAYYFCLFPPEQWQTAWLRLRLRLRSWANGRLASADGSPPNAPAADALSARGLGQVLGFLILLHLLAITLLAIPSPGSGLNRAAWQNPTVQGEFTIWAERLRNWGVDVTPRELEEHLWQTAVRYEALRDKVLAPFRPYYNYCGTYQSWKMFVAPHRFPTRLHIEVKEGGAWRLVYAERDGKHRWLCTRLDFHRMRPVLFRHGWPGYEEDYQAFAHWVAGQAVRDFPNASHVRLRLYRYRTLAPEEVRQGQFPEGEFINPVVLPLRCSSQHYRERPAAETGWPPLAGHRAAA